MKKLTAFFTLLLFVQIKVYSCGSAPTPTISGPYGTHTYINPAPSLGTVTDVLTSCNDSGITLNFNASQEWKNESGNTGCGVYAGNYWYKNGVYLAGNVNGYTFDPDNLSEGIQQIRVQTYTVNQGGTCSKNFYYAFTVIKEQRIPDLRAEGQAYAQGQQVTEQSSIQVWFGQANHGQDICEPTKSSIQVWWSKNSSFDESTALKKELFTGITIQDGFVGDVTTKTISVPSLDELDIDDHNSAYIFFEANPDNSILEAPEDNNNISDGSRVIVREKVNRLSSGTISLEELRNGEINIILLTDISGKILVQNQNVNVIDWAKFPKNQILIVNYSIDGEVKKEKIAIVD